MSKHIISESQLRQIVEESVRTYLMENGMDEAGNPLDFVRSVGAGLRNAFDGDVNRTKGALKKAWGRTKEAGQTLMNNVVDGAQTVGRKVADGITGAYNQTADELKQRKDAFVQNYQAQQQATAAADAAKSGAKQAEKAIATLRKLQQKGVISSNGAVQALNQLEKCLNMQTMRRNQYAGQMQAKVK